MGRRGIMAVIGLCLVVSFFSFQNCSGGGGGGGTSLANLPSMGQVLSEEDFATGDALYNGGDFSTQEVKTEYHQPLNAPNKISSNSIIGTHQTYNGDLLIENPASVAQLITNGEPYNVMGYTCMQNFNFSGMHITNAMNLNIGSCPYDLRALSDVSNYVSVLGKLEVVGDLHVIGLVVINESATLRVHGKIMIGAGPDQPGVIVVNKGFLEGNNEGRLTFGASLDNGSIFIID